MKGADLQSDVSATEALISENNRDYRKNVGRILLAKPSYDTLYTFYRNLPLFCGIRSIQDNGKLRQESE